MRSEIYSRIRQNKMKFYAELNNTKQKSVPTTVIEVKEPVAKPVHEKKPREKNVLLKKVQEFDYKSIFKKVPEAVKTGYQGTVKSKALVALKTQVKNDHEKIKQFSAQVNQKIDRQTDKLAHGVFNISSFLFEDQIESKGSPALSGNALAIEAVGNNTIEWDVSAESQPTVSVYDKIGEFSDKTFDWLRTVPGKINDFLASDNLMEPNEVHMIARR
jgi:hypothetical protein